MSQNAHLNSQTENYNTIASMKNCVVKKICPIQMEHGGGPLHIDAESQIFVQWLFKELIFCDVSELNQPLCAWFSFKIASP